MGKPEPVGFTLTEGEGEEPSHLTATLMLRLRAWRPYQLQCVADAFSTKFETEQTPQTVQMESLACTLDETVTLTGSGPLPDAGAKILACFASFGPALLAYRENNWDLTSRVTVTAFGENSLSELESYEKVLEEMRQRDYNDSHRAAAPLRAAEDAIVVDTSALDFDASREALLALIREKLQ